VLGGWVLEKAARCKPNGRLFRRSPLSNLIELEGLLLGVQGKAADFRALRRLADTDTRHPTPDTDTDTDTDTDFRPTPSMSSSPAPSNKPTPCNSFEYPPQPTYSPPPDNARKGKPGWSGRRQASTCYRVAQWGARSPLRVPCLAGRCGPGSVRECGE